MTDTERIELRKMLAEKVMEWKTDFEYWECAYTVGEWVPDLEISHAFMVAEKIGGLELVDVGPRWRASIGDITGYTRAKTPALAICLAAREWLKAKGKGQ